MGRRGQDRRAKKGETTREETVSYAAFISYRHTDPDRAWARWLHGAIENYTVPSPIRSQRGLPRRIGRVFRDEDELATSSDLGASIRDALNASRHLIVVCSPRTPASRWVEQEIREFREHEGSDYVLSLLIDGEPQDAFPAPLREIRPDGSDTLEPLAADVRAESGESLRYARRMALLRILATMLDVRFDDLRRRDHERRMRRVVTTAILAVVLGVVMAGLTALAWHQSNVARAATDRATALARRVRSVALTLASRAELDNDPVVALHLARRALELDVSPSTLSALHTSLVASNERVVIRGHEGGTVDQGVLDLTFSPDDRYLLTGGADGTARLWHLDGRPAALLEGHEKAVVTVAFSPDGRRVATGSEDGTARIWSLEGKLLHLLEDHTGTVSDLSFDAAGCLVTASEDGTARLWDQDGLELAVLRGHEGPILQVATARRLPIGNEPTRATIVTASADGTARLWNRSGGHVAVLDGHDGKVSAAAFCGSGDRIATGSHGGEVGLWDSSGASLGWMREHRGPVSCVAFVGLGWHLVASGSYDATCRLWNPEDNTVTVLRGHEDAVHGVAFSYRGHVVATASRNTIRTWWLDGDPIHVFRGHTGWFLTDVAFSHDGEHLASASVGPDATARLWSAWGGEKSVLVNTKCCRRLEVSPDSTIVAQARDSARLWHIDGRPLGGEIVFANAIAFSADGRRIGVLPGLAVEADNVASQVPDLGLEDIEVVVAMGGGDRMALVSGDEAVVSAEFGGREVAELFDRKGRTIATLEGHEDFISDLAFSPGATLVATASSDETARLWRRNGAAVAVLRHESAVERVVFSPDGRALVTIAESGAVRLWRADGEAVATLSVEGSWARAAAATRDGSRVLVGYADGTVRLWGRGGKVVATMRGHSEDVRDVAFSPDESMIASGAVDGTVRLWSADGEEIGALEGHLKGIERVVFSPNGRWLLTSSEDGTVRVWCVRAEDLLALSAERSTRPLTDEDRARYADLLD